MYSVETLNAWTDFEDPDDSKKPKIQERRPPLGKLPFIRQRRGPITGWRLLFDSESDNFNLGIGWVIVANAIVLGLETDFGHAHFEIFEHIFLFLFCAEMFARIAQLGLEYFQDPWYVCLDFPLVVSGCLDLWILPLCQGSDSGETTAYQFSVLRLLRMLRLLRVLRLIRIFRMFHHLQLIVKAFSKAIHVVLLISLIVVILIYSLSIVFTQLVGQTSVQWPKHEQDKVELYFGTVGHSMTTLFNVMFANDWDELEEVLTKVYPTGLVLAIFAGYTVITISLVSLIIGLISESLLFAQEDFKTRKLASFDKKKKQLATEFMATISDELKNFTDANGTVKGDKLMYVFKKDPVGPTMLEKLTDIGVSLNVEQLQGVVDGMVKNDERVTIDLFIEKLIHLSGESQASSIVDIKYEVLKNYAQLENFAQQVVQLETKFPSSSKNNSSNNKSNK